MQKIPLLTRAVRNMQAGQAFTNPAATAPAMPGDSVPIAPTVARLAGIPLLDRLIGQVLSYPNDRYLKEPQVVTIISRSKAAMRRDISLGVFPSQIKTGTKSSAWRESEVMGWVEATTILSRVANPGFGIKDFVAALSVTIRAKP